MKQSPQETDNLSNYKRIKKSTDTLPPPWSRSRRLRFSLWLTKKVNILPAFLRTNLQRVNEAKKVVNIHYNLDAKMYRLMLGPSMKYSCAYHPDKSKPFDLDKAQEADFNLAAKKVRLKKGMRVLDIGCGNGTLAYYLAQNFGVKVVGVNISESQLRYGRKLCKDLPNVELRLQDYREIDDGPFDAIISKGMFEHVGPLNYRAFFEKVSELLTDDGLFLLHTIGSNTSRTKCNLLSNTFIFPGGVVPSIEQIKWGINNRFYVGDWHSLEGDYALTLSAWHKNIFSNSDKLQKINPKKYGRWFRFVCDKYLTMSKACFESENEQTRLQLWQVLLSKDKRVKALKKIR